MGAVRIVEICFVNIITDPALIYTYRKSLSDPSRHFLINEAILYALLLKHYQNIFYALLSKYYIRPQSKAESSFFWSVELRGSLTCWDMKVTESHCAI